MVFEGTAPTLQELVDHVLSRLHLVPRYRQRLAYVPLGQGRPVWTDDPHFNPYYHIRHTALPKPADDAALKRLAGRLFSQRLDRSKPLWEIWLVQSMSGGRFALIAKTHHALVDGISGVDITTVLFDTAREPAPTAPAAPWSAKPLPGPAKLLGEALLERSTVPAEMVRGARALLRAPAQARLAGQGRPRERRRDDARRASTPRRRRARSTSTSGRTAATPSWTPTWRRFKAIKDSLGGTLNDVVLASVSLALGRYLRRHGHDTEGLVLKAMVPVSVRTKAQRGALGNQVAAMWAPLPGRRREPGRVPAQDRRGDGGPEEVRPGGGRAGADQPRRVRSARRSSARPRACRPASRSSTSSSPTCPGRSSRSTCSAGACEVLYPVVPARPAPGARDRRHELRRPSRLRAARRLRRAAGPRGDRARPAVGDRLARARRRRAPASAPRARPSPQAAARRREAPANARPGAQPASAGSTRPRARSATPDRAAEPVAGRRRQRLTRGRKRASPTLGSRRSAEPAAPGAVCRARGADTIRACAWPSAS